MTPSPPSMVKDHTFAHFNFGSFWTSGLSVPYGHIPNWSNEGSAINRTKQTCEFSFSKLYIFVRKLSTASWLYSFHWFNPEENRNIVEILQQKHCLFHLRQRNCSIQNRILWAGKLSGETVESRIQGVRVINMKIIHDVKKTRMLLTFGKTGSSLMSPWSLRLTWIKKYFYYFLYYC